jgi:predicted dehydrogenase
MSEKTRIGIVGCGNFASRTHWPLWSSMNDVSIEAVCDLLPDRTQDKAEQYKVPRQYDNAVLMIDQEELDAVILILPPEPVFDIAMHAFKRRISVFSEKPAGMNSEQARKLAYAAEDNGCHSQVGLNRRFCPVVKAAKERILQVGIPQSCGAIYNKFEFTPPGWNAGDYLLVDGIHAVDCLFYLANSFPKKIYPYSHRAKSGFLSRYSVMIEFENGCIGTYMGNYHSGVRREAFEVHGKGISAYINSPDKAEIFVENKVFVQPQGEIITDVDMVGTTDRNISYGYIQEFRHFVEVVQGRREPEITMREIIPVMDLVDTIRKAD